MPWQLYVGTYTQKLPHVNGKGEGIYYLEIDAKSGALSTPRLVAHTPNPSFLAIDSSHQRLFAVNELEWWRGHPQGTVTGFRILRDGNLTKIGRRSTSGTSPCYISVEPGGQGVLVANYSSGSVTRLHVRAQGDLCAPGAHFVHQGKGPNKLRQEAPHAHSIQPDPGGRWAIAADLGTDQLIIYRRSRFRLFVHRKVNLHAGAGPRHFTFSGDSHRLYVANELDSTVSVFSFELGVGSLQHLQTLSALPVGYSQENTLADIHLHPNGRYLYASNRGHNSIAIFAVDQEGLLKPLDHISSQGKIPRNFAITPDGSYLIVANQDSDNLVVFQLDTRTGLLTPNGFTAFVPTPVCISIKNP